ncbi:TRNA-2-methylthio-N(6)-dimethylallyladenosine synthase [Actinidia chinensis var. chinensis]|uniref:tRNA-2-methylthio-N(6)-dimethylallyladenosine synthase n=1 Tax=Actinidia chinensis var. chinensis TaxID=1590841 RepID=A0A2R6Q4X9_ACTCC|nr:TRNA-2-methylthio-N(6)-dimethylallyladenosine synthase [Actinidia chinensis var. chinensis]
MADEPKRRKIHPPPFRRTASIRATKDDSATTSINTLAVHVAQTSNIHLSIQQAKNHAVAQTQQEGCMANFRIFDSMFGNFLLPAIPTRAELSKTRRRVEAGQDQLNLYFKSTRPSWCYLLVTISCGLFP